MESIRGRQTVDNSIIIYLLPVVPDTYLENLEVLMKITVEINYFGIARFSLHQSFTKELNFRVIDYSYNNNDCDGLGSSSNKVIEKFIL